MDGRAGSDPRPIIPALGQYYGLTSDLAYLIVRVTAGVFVFVHGWIKVTAMTHAGLTGYFAKLGIEPAGFWAYYIPFNETVVALLVAIGLLTRPAALLLVIEFIVLILVVHVPRGCKRLGISTVLAAGVDRRSVARWRAVFGRSDDRQRILMSLHN
jgi:uncharacterized membrane protein YphA (DoxX/SURF4 family)